MGVLSSLFGSGSGDQSGGPDGTADRKYAILLNAGFDRTPVAGNGFNYAVELEDAGYDVQLFLDGSATWWPTGFAENSDGPFILSAVTTYRHSAPWGAEILHRRTAGSISHDRVNLQERGLLAGVCGYCANAFDVAGACKNSGIELLSDKTEHAPAVATLAAENYEMLTDG